MAFKVVQKNGLIILLGSDYEALVKKVNMIVQYTAAVDPNHSPGHAKIHKLKKTSQFFNGEFTHGVTLSRILPRMVESFYGEHKIPGNCHGAALVASGIYPLMRWGYSNDINVSDHQVHLNVGDALSPGDVINLNGLDHSLVYLDEDLCLSMNGSGRTLEFYPLKDVLETYGSNLAALREVDRVTIYRKLPDWVYPEPLLDILREFYCYRNSATSGFNPGTDEYDQAEKLARAFYREIGKHNIDGEALALPQLYHRAFLANLPLGMLDKLPRPIQKDEVELASAHPELSYQMSLAGW